MSENREGVKFAIFDPHWPDSDGATRECVWCGQAWPCEDAERAQRQYDRVCYYLDREKAAP